MYTSTELQLLRNADPGVKLPGIDTPAGDPLAAGSLKPLSSMTTSSKAPFYYSAAANVVYVTQAGATLSGYNFGNATVDVDASNVTIEDCNFTATTGWYAVQVHDGENNTTVTNSSFNSDAIPAKLAAWITSTGTVNVTDNSFIDTPADGLDVFGGGVISGNYFSGAGYSSSGLHPDAIWITNSTTPFVISDNFIDETTNPNSVVGTNDCIRITAELGSVSNVTVTGNFLIGGNTSIDAGNSLQKGTSSNISITGNYMGFGIDWAFYPGKQEGVTASGNVVFDYSNSAYSATAWAAYEAAGLPTANLMVSTGGSNVNGSSETASTTLYGGSTGVHLFGGSFENNFVGGYGRQFFSGGRGANIFTYLSPANSPDTPPSLEDNIVDFDPNKDVIDLSHIDANVTPGVLKNFTFIGTNAFTGAGAQVRYQLDPTDNATIVQVTLAGDTSPDMVIDLSGQLNLTAANFALTSSQSQTDLANGAALSVSLVRSGATTDYVYTNVKGRAFSSYTSVLYSNNDAADDLNLSATSNEIDLYQNNITLTRAGQTESLAIGASTSNLAYHANETIQVGNAGAETFALSGNGGEGYGKVSINGFAASGTNADTLVLSKSDFSYLTSAMTQAQDLAAVLSHVSTGSNGVSIADRWGDNVNSCRRQRLDAHRQPRRGEIRLTDRARNLGEAARMSAALPVGNHQA